jgi:hypothetical protein
MLWNNHCSCMMKVCQDPTSFGVSRKINKELCSLVQVSITG